MKLARRAFACVVLLGLLLVGCVYAFPDEILPLAAEWLDIGETPEVVDFVVALPGDNERRPFVAAALVNAGLADKAIVVQTAAGPDVEDGIRPPDYEIVKAVLRCRGVPADKIVVLDGSSESTADDMELVGRYIGRQPDSRLAVVTSAFHTRRARWTLRRRLSSCFDRITVVAAPDPGFDSDRWWQRETGARLIISEYIKLLCYWLLYGYGWLWLLGASCVLLIWRRTRVLRRPDGVASDPGKC